MARGMEARNSMEPLPAERAVRMAKALSGLPAVLPPEEQPKFKAMTSEKWGQIKQNQGPRGWRWGIKVRAAMRAISEAQGHRYSGPGAP